MMARLIRILRGTMSCPMCSFTGEESVVRLHVVRVHNSF